MSTKLDGGSINFAVHQAAAKTGLPLETVERCWDALCDTLEPFIERDVERRLAGKSWLIRQWITWKWRLTRKGT